MSKKAQSSPSVQPLRDCGNSGLCRPHGGFHSGNASFPEPFRGSSSRLFDSQIHCHISFLEPLSDILIECKTASTHQKRNTFKRFFHISKSIYFYGKILIQPNRHSFSKGVFLHSISFKAINCC